MWVRNNPSTMISQLVDTTLFITIAFYGTLPIGALIALILTQYSFKFIVAVMDTPLVYLLVKWCRRAEKNNISIRDAQSA